MDRSAWKLQDPEWVKMREKQWLGLQRYLNKLVELDNEIASINYLHKARAFFDGTEIEFPTAEQRAKKPGTPDWKACVALHPDPTVVNIRDIYNDWAQHNTKEWTHGYPKSYVVIQSDWAPLIASGVLDASIVDNFMAAIYGNSFDEAIALRHVDVGRDLGTILEEMMIYIGNWLVEWSKSPTDYIPYKRLLVQLLGMFSKVEDEQLPNLEFVLGRFFRIVHRFESFETATLPRPRDFVESFRQAMQENRDSWCPKLRPYIDGDESVLS